MSRITTGARVLIVDGSHRGRAGVVAARLPGGPMGVLKVTVDGLEGAPILFAGWQVEPAKEETSK